MTTEDYAPITCKAHDKADCTECMATMTVNTGEAGLSIKPSAYDSIAKYAFQCTTHNESYFISACAPCVREQLAAEYERGKADGRAEAKEEKP